MLPFLSEFVRRGHSAYCPVALRDLQGQEQWQSAGSQRSSVSVDGLRLRLYGRAFHRSATRAIALSPLPLKMQHRLSEQRPVRCKTLGLTDRD